MIIHRLINWIDSSQAHSSDSEHIAWIRIIPFILLHLACFAVIWVGVSPVALYTALGLFWLRIFSIGAFYHRYFSHRTYKANRFWQCVFAFLGATSTQRGPIWWAAHHRHHHQCTDQTEDPHSPITQGFWKSHIGWFLTNKHFAYDPRKVQDLLKFPELRFIDRFDVLVPLLVGAALLVAGHLLAIFMPQLHTSAAQLFVWGFVISTIISTHVTVSINSFGHLFGSQPYNNHDASRNNLLLALLTLGEGWHNNHHRYPATAQQGFRWWEIDITFYLLVLMEKVGIISELRRVPKRIKQEPLNCE